MMKKFILGIVLLNFLAPPAANAFSNHDFVPTNLTFQTILDDDVLMTYSQHAYITIKNVGSTSYNKAFGYKIRVAIGYIEKYGFIYGSDIEGGSLGGEIAPGKTGKIVVRFPLDELVHCKEYRVHIDLDQAIQPPPPIGRFYNDKANLVAREVGRPAFCGPFPKSHL